MEAKENKSEGEPRDRLIEFIEREQMTKKEFVRRVGLSGSYLINLKRMPSQKVLSRILKAFPNLSVEWLLTGEGEMRVNERCAGVRYYHGVDKRKDGVGFLDDKKEPFVTIAVPDMPENCFAIKAEGDGMYPLIRYGDIVFMREQCGEPIQFGAVYMVVVNGYRLIRRLCEGQVGSVRCETEDGCAVTVAPEDIERRFIVCGRLSTRIEERKTNN